MAYFYIKSGFGTRTASTGVTEQSGAFSGLAAGDVYASLTVLVANASFTTDDIIIVSDGHSETLTSTLILGITTSGGATRVMMVSVADLDCQAYSDAASAQFTMGSAGSIDFRQVHSFGIHYLTTVVAGLKCLTTPGMAISFNDGTIAMSTVANQYIMRTSALATNISFRKVAFTTSSVGCTPFYSNATHARIHFCGCQFAVTGSGTYRSLFKDNNNPIDVCVNGCDLSEFPLLIENIGGITNDDAQRYRFNDCEVPASVDWLEETVAIDGFRLEAFNCTDATNNNPNQLFIEDYSGTVESAIDTAIGSTHSVRTDGTEMSMESAGKFMSAKVITNSNCSKMQPLSFELPVKWSELSNGAADTIRFYLASSVTLTDLDVIATAVYRDGTNSEQILAGISSGAEGFNPIEAGTELTADAVSTWTNDGALNLYYLDIATSGGLDQYPIIEIHVRKTGTIYIDTEYDLVA